MITQLPITHYLKSRPNLAELLVEHHIEGLFYYYDKESRDNKELKKRWLLQWQHNELLKEEVKQLSDELKGKKLCVLKGVSLISDIYHDYGSRFMSDIDLLIKKENIPYIQEILLQKGYKNISEKKWEANDFKSEWNKFIGGNEVTIELHTQLYYHVENSFSSFSKDLRSIDNYFQLGIEDKLIHLCTHLGFQHSFLKLYWLYDIHFYILQFSTQINWERVEKEAKVLKVKNSFYITLFILEKFFRTPIPIKIKIKKRWFWSFLFTKEFLLSQKRRNLRFLLIKHVTKDSLIEAIRYDLLYFFSKKEKKEKK